MNRDKKSLLLSSWPMGQDDVVEKLAAYESLGNKFLLVESAVHSSKTVKKLCGKARDLGFDGVLIVDSKKAKVFVFNVDESYGEFSVNGARCAALYLMQKNRTEYEEFFVGTVPVEAFFERENYLSVKIKAPKSKAVEVAMNIGGKVVVGNFINVGNPHFVLFGDNNLTEKEFAEVALILAQGNSDTAGAVNASFFLQEKNDCYRAIVYERGVGFTQFCGSAALAFWTINSFEKNISISMPGGETKISYSFDGFVKMLAPVVQIGRQKTLKI
jgi:diaminopimelate epimerase